MRIVVAMDGSEATAWMDSLRPALPPFQRAARDGRSPRFRHGEGEDLGMRAREVAMATPGSGMCSLFRPAQADWIYPVAGYCEGAPAGLMIPSIDEYRRWCSTAAHAACPIHQLRLVACP